MLVICSDTEERCLRRNCPCARSIDVEHFYRGRRSLARDAHFSCRNDQEFTILCRKSIRSRGHLVSYSNFMKGLF